MATCDLAVYTFSQGQEITVEIFDPDSPAGVAEYDITGHVTKIEKADGVTKVFIWSADHRFILVLPGEV